MSSTWGSNAAGGERSWNRSCPCCAATSALARVPRSASAMWSTVTSIPFAVPQSLAYLSNHTSYEGTKWLHWRILSVFCRRLIRMVGPSAAAARVAPVVVTNSRRSIRFLVMDLPPCVRLHRPFMAGQNCFVGPWAQGVTAGTPGRGGGEAARKGPTGKKAPGGAPGGGPPRRPRERAGGHRGGPKEGG